MQKRMKEAALFSFSHATRDKILKEILSLDIN